MAKSTNPRNRRYGAAAMLALAAMNVMAGNQAHADTPALHPSPDDVLAAFSAQFPDQASRTAFIDAETGDINQSIVEASKKLGLEGDAGFDSKMDEMRDLHASGRGGRAIFYEKNGEGFCVANASLDTWHMLHELTHCADLLSGAKDASGIRLETLAEGVSQIIKSNYLGSAGQSDYNDTKAWYAARYGTEDTYKLGQGIDPYQGMVEIDYIDFKGDNPLSHWRSTFETVRDGLNGLSNAHIEQQQLLQQTYYTVFTDVFKGNKKDYQEWLGVLKGVSNADRTLAAIDQQQNGGEFTPAKISQMDLRQDYSRIKKLLKANPDDAALITMKIGYENVTDIRIPTSQQRPQSPHMSFRF